jgi:hypothetical protein
VFDVFGRVSGNDDAATGLRFKDPPQGLPRNFGVVTRGPEMFGKR